MSDGREKKNSRAGIYSGLLFASDIFRRTSDRFVGLFSPEIFRRTSGQFIGLFSDIFRFASSECVFPYIGLFSPFMASACFCRFSGCFIDLACFCRTSGRFIALFSDIFRRTSGRLIGSACFCRTSDRFIGLFSPFLDSDIFRRTSGQFMACDISLRAS